MKVWKILGRNRRCCHGGVGRWPPPGEWLEVTGPLKMCHHGLHLCREQDLLQWLNSEIWEAEYKGEIIKDGDKVCARRARLTIRLDTWNERSARLLAADYAEAVLPIFERARPNDDRPRKAIEAARAFARGEISTAATNAAAREATSVVGLAGPVRAAVSSSATAAVNTIYYNIANVTYVAASAAYATHYAARKAARHAAKRRQTEQLMAVLYPEEKERNG